VEEGKYRKIEFPDWKSVEKGKISFLPLIRGKTEFEEMNGRGEK
jgi:hypothetical protein